mmetsp:Transcript_72494/g.221986  ORF Transcript_72494/g.221986 Transcript_72494/m.221986 type:complete len:223 (+) Transcript_72494:442-1110(+)
MSAHVLASKPTSSIISPPPRKGGASRRTSARPQRKPMPEGPHILWPLATSQSAPKACTSTGACGTLWQASRSTRAPTARARRTTAATGLAQPSTLDTWARLTRRVRSVSTSSSSEQSKVPSGVRPKKRSLQPTSAASICQGTRFEWCSMTVSKISSPGPTFARAHVRATRLIASVALRVKTISHGSAAFTNFATRARAPSNASVARIDIVCMPRWTLLLSAL